MSISYANIAAGSKMPSELTKEDTITSATSAEEAVVSSTEASAVSDSIATEPSQSKADSDKKETSEQSSSNSNSHKKKKKDSEKSSDETKATEDDAAAAVSSTSPVPKKANLTPAPIPATSAWGSTRKSSAKPSIPAESSKWPAPSVEQPQQKKASQPPVAKNTGKEKWVPFEANVQIASSKSSKPHNAKKSNRKKNSSAAPASASGAPSSAASSQAKSENSASKSKSTSSKSQKRKSDGKKDTKPTSDAISAKQKSATEKSSTEHDDAAAIPAASVAPNTVPSTVTDVSSENASSSAPATVKSTESNVEQYTDSSSSNTNSAASNNGQHSKSSNGGYNKFNGHHSNNYNNNYHGKNSRYPRSSNNHYKKQHSNNKHMYSNANNGAASNMMYKQMQFTPGFIPQGVPIGYYDQFGYQGIPPPPMNKMHKGFPAGGVPIGSSAPFFAPQTDFQYPTMPMRQFVPQQQPNEDLFELLTNQISYYFSTENLKKDMYLRKLMNSQGYVPIMKIASFFRVSKLTGGNYDMVIAAIQQTKGLEIKNQKVRLASDFESWVLPFEEREQEGKDESMEEAEKQEE